jgi:Flp pilus assembly protein TadD
MILTLMHRPKTSQHLGRTLLLVLLCFIVYRNALHGDFVWDDQMQVVRNSNIRTLDNIPRTFVSSLWSFIYAPGENDRDRASHQYYRPIQTIIYILVYQLSGLSPFAYHLANVALHSAATVALYFLCIELGLSSIVATLASALFAVHPVHTEAVSWIAGVGDTSSGLFYFAGLWAFVRYLNRKTWRWLWLSCALCLAALFSKEMAVTFPAVAFLLIFLRRKKERPVLRTALVTVTPFLLPVVIYTVFRTIAVGSHLRSLEQTDATIVDWTTLLVRIVGEYLRYMIVPYPLFIYHLVPLHLQDRVLSTVLYGVGLLTLGVIAWSLRYRFSKELVCLGVFLLALAPVLYFPGISGGVFFAERYLYIPSIATALLAAFILARLNTKHAIIITCVLAGVFSVLTIQRNSEWSNEERLFGHTLEVQPETATFRTSLGEIYLRRGDDERAQEYFRRSLEDLADKRFLSDPYETYRVYLGLGIAKARQSKTDEAMGDLKKALDIYPQGDGAYATLGGILVSRKDYPGATVLLEKAIQLSAVNELARDYMGVALVNQGQYEQAVKYFREALQINPDLESAKQHLQVALQAMNR